MTAPRSRKTKVSVFLTPAQARRLKVLAATEGLAGVSELVAGWLAEHDEPQAAGQAERQRAVTPC